MEEFDEIVEDYFGIKSPTKRELYKVIHKLILFIIIN